MSDKDTLGAHLRRGRERSGLTVDAVSAGSRIVPRLVEALESDRQDLLPAPVYVRGFIRAYCEQIGADTGEALRLYDEQAAPDPPLTVRDPPPSRPAGARRWGRVAAISALAGAVGVAGFVLLGRRPPDAGASRRAGGTMTASRSSPAPPPVERATPAPPRPRRIERAGGGRAACWSCGRSTPPGCAYSRTAPRRARKRCPPVPCASGGARGGFTSRSGTRAASSSSWMAARCRRWALRARWSGTRPCRARLQP